MRSPSGSLLSCTSSRDPILEHLKKHNRKKAKKKKKLRAYQCHTCENKQEGKQMNQSGGNGGVSGQNGCVDTSVHATLACTCLYVCTPRRGEGATLLLQPPPPLRCSHERPETKKIKASARRAVYRVGCTTISLALWHAYTGISTWHIPMNVSVFKGEVWEQGCHYTHNATLHPSPRAS